MCTHVQDPVCNGSVGSFILEGFWHLHSCHRTMCRGKNTTCMLDSLRSCMRISVFSLVSRSGARHQKWMTCVLGLETRHGKAAASRSSAFLPWCWMDALLKSYGQTARGTRLLVHAKFCQRGAAHAKESGLGTMIKGSIPAFHELVSISPSNTACCTCDDDSQCLFHGQSRQTRAAPAKCPFFSVFPKKEAGAQT